MSGFIESLILLLIGIGLSGLLIPWITRQWQNQQKALEIKSELIEDITELGTEMFLAVIKPSAVRLISKEEDTDTDLAARLFEWVVRSQVIASRLKLYFGAELSDRWTRISDLHQKFILASAQKTGGLRAEALRYLQEALGDQAASLIDWETYSLSEPEAGSAEQKAEYIKAEQTLVAIIRQQREELIETILQSRATGEFDIKDFFRLYD